MNSRLSSWFLVLMFVIFGWQRWRAADIKVFQHLQSAELQSCGSLRSVGSLSLLLVLWSLQSQAALPLISCERPEACQLFRKVLTKTAGKPLEQKHASIQRMRICDVAMQVRVLGSEKQLYDNFISPISHGYINIFFFPSPYPLFSSSTHGLRVDWGCSSTLPTVTMATLSGPTKDQKPKDILDNNTIAAQPGYLRDSDLRGEIRREGGGGSKSSVSLSLPPPRTQTEPGLENLKGTGTM